MHMSASNSNNMNNSNIKFYCVTYQVAKCTGNRTIYIVHKKCQEADTLQIIRTGVDSIMQLHQ